MIAQDLLWCCFRSPHRAKYINIWGVNVLNAVRSVKGALFMYMQYIVECHNDIFLISMDQMCFYTIYLLCLMCRRSFICGEVCGHICRRQEEAGDGKLLYVKFHRWQDPLTSLVPFHNQFCCSFLYFFVFFQGGGVITRCLWNVLSENIQLHLFSLTLELLHTWSASLSLHDAWWVNAFSFSCSCLLHHSLENIIFPHLFFVFVVCTALF